MTGTAYLVTMNRTVVYGVYAIYTTLYLALIGWKVLGQ